MQRTVATHKVPARALALPRRALDDQRIAFAPSDERNLHQTQYPRVHELGHAVGLGYSQYGREKAEMLVDSTYVVCSSAGLDVGGESIPYIAGWGEDGALDAIREYAKTIDEIARRIENALSDGSDATAAQAEQAA